MPRLCSTCQHPKRSYIDRQIAAGVPAARIAREFSLNPSSLHRHRANCIGLKSAPAVMKEASRASVALASLPSRDQLGQAYGSLCTRIDEIVQEARTRGSLAIALQGLNALRQSLDSLARLAGHKEAHGEQFTVTINIGADSDVMTFPGPTNTRSEF